MRTAIAILLLCIASSSSLLKVGVVAWYECNKTYISQNLCENRNKPQLKCCGKCYLRKQLSKAEGKQAQGAKPLQEKISKIEIPVFVIPSIPAIKFNHLAVAAEKHAPYNYPFSEGIMLPVLHPPG